MADCAMLTCVDGDGVRKDRKLDVNTSPVNATTADQIIAKGLVGKTPIASMQLGLLNGSGEFDGRPAEDAKRAIVDWLAERGRAEPAINFRLRDWGFSRQRYWGCPIPIVYCDDCGMVAVPESELPVRLPEIEDYQPRGKSPLASAEDWVNTTCPSCGGPARREAAPILVPSIPTKRRRDERCSSTRSRRG